MQLPSEELLNLFRPIGSLYWSKNSTDPSTLFGGTWQRVKDVFILAAGDTYSAGTSGGEATHKLTTNEMPAHNHDMKGYTIKWGNGTNKTHITTPMALGDTTNNEPYVTDDTTANTGGGQAHNNMPPYKAYYCWERIA